MTNVTEINNNTFKMDFDGNVEIMQQVQGTCPYGSDCWYVHGLYLTLLDT